MLFLAVFLYVLITGAAYWFSRRYAVLRRGHRLAYTFTVAPVLMAGGVLGLMIIDLMFDLGGLIDAAEAADEAFAEEHAVLAVLLEVAGLPAQTFPFVAMLCFTPGAAIGVLGWYRILRKLDRATPEERAARERSIADRAAEDREVERRFARVRAEMDARVRGPRGAECPRCKKKLTFFNRAHGDNLRVCAACYRALAHLGSARPILKRIRAEVRAERSEARLRTEPDDP
jgi:hypothetical protein